MQWVPIRVAGIVDITVYYGISSLVEDAANGVLLHNDIIRIFPLDETYPTSSHP